MILLATVVFPEALPPHKPAQHKQNYTLPPKKRTIVFLRHSHRTQNLQNSSHDDLSPKKGVQVYFMVQNTKQQPKIVTPRDLAL